MDHDTNWYRYIHCDRKRNIYRCADERPFWLPGCDDVGTLSQPFNLSGMPGTIRLDVDLPQDIALDHLDEREPQGGLGDPIGLRKGHFGLGPTRRPREASG